MRSATARVTNQGINRFGVLYTNYELSFYIGQTVRIKWDLVSMLQSCMFMTLKVAKRYVKQNRRSFCTITATYLRKRWKSICNQKRQQKETQEFLDAVRKGYTELVDEGRKTATVGGLDLALKPERKQKVVSLPVDAGYRQGRRQKKAEENEFLQSKGNEALERLRAIQG